MAPSFSKLRGEAFGLTDLGVYASREYDEDVTRSSGSRWDLILAADLLTRLDQLFYIFIDRLFGDRIVMDWGDERWLVP